MSPVLQTGKTLIVVFNLVCASALARSASAPLGDFAPCDAEADGYSEVVEAVINTPLIGERFVSYTHYPSFSSESGVRVFRTEDGYVLRAVEFDQSAWHSGYREIRPNTFARSASQARYERSVHEATLAPRVANLLQEVVARELRTARAENERMGFDGSTHVFSTEDLCAPADTPSLGSRAQRLIEVFETLETQAALPTRGMQVFWEQRALAQLLVLSGESSMTEIDPWMEVASALLIVAAAAFPLLVASVAAFAPRMLGARTKFVFVSGALSYGWTCIAGVVLLPLFLASRQLLLFEDERTRLSETAQKVLGLADSWPLILFILWVTSSIVVPVYMRGRWPRPGDVTRVTHVRSAA